MTWKFQPFVKLFAPSVVFMFVHQATSDVIRNVVLEALDSNHKNRLLAEASSAASCCEVSQDPLLLKGEAELAYLTHEGLFISDALSEARQEQAGQDQNFAASVRVQQNRDESAGSIPACGVTEISVSREQSLMWVILFFFFPFLFYFFFFVLGCQTAVLWRCWPAGFLPESNLLDLGKNNTLNFLKYDFELLCAEMSDYETIGSSLAGRSQRKKTLPLFFFKCRREMVEKMLNPANVTEKLRIQNVCDARLKWFGCA